MVDFICIGLLQLQGAETEDHKMKKKILPTAALELTTHESQSYYRSH